jgi:hypothetical protein
MRIGFTGVGGTGKSTTMELIRETLDLPVLGSTSRSVFEKWNISESDQEKMTPQEKWKLQREIFDTRLDAEKSYVKGFLSDRTIVDNYVYCLVRCYEAINSEELSEVEKMVRKNTSQYDVIFFFSMDAFIPEDDGMRQNHIPYRRLVENAMRGALNSPLCLADHVIEVPCGTPQDRAEFVLNKITEIKKAQIESIGKV